MKSRAMPVSALNTTFLKAAQKGDLDDVSEKLADHADVNTTDINGRTGLYLAASNGDRDMVMLLLTHKGDVNIADNEGLTALTAALQAKEFDIASLLLKNKADINQQGGDKNISALHSAVNMDLREAEAKRVEFLLDNGIDFANLRNSSGQTAREAAEALRARFPEAQALINAFDAHIEGKENHTKRLEREAVEERHAAVFGGLKQPMPVKPIRFKPKSPAS